MLVRCRLKSKYTNTHNTHTNLIQRSDHMDVGGRFHHLDVIIACFDFPSAAPRQNRTLDIPRHLKYHQRTQGNSSFVDSPYLNSIIHGVTARSDNSYRIRA